jgi:hypothetical protein
MYYKIETTQGTEPEVYLCKSAALYSARLRFDDAEFCVVPYTLPERLEAALLRLWALDANGAAAAMSDLYDGAHPLILAIEIEETLANLA